MPNEPTGGDESAGPEESEMPPKAERVDKVSKANRAGKGEDRPKLKEWMSESGPDAAPEEAAPIEWEYDEHLPEKSVIPELQGDGIVTGMTYPPTAEELAAHEAAMKEIEAEVKAEVKAEDDIQFSDPIGDVIEDLQEMQAHEILEEQREFLDSIEEKKRRQAEAEEERATAPERARKARTNLLLARLAAGIAAVLAFAYACNQLVGDDEPVDTQELGGGDSTTGETALGQDETAPGPTDSRPALECAAGSSGPDTALTAQLAAEISGAADQTYVPQELASTASGAAFEVGSYIFTLTVFGDGETVSTAPTTKWYNPRFIVNNDASTNTYEPGGFAVDVGWWGDDKKLDAAVLDENFTRMPAAEASVDVEWLDSSTLRVITTIEGPQIEVTNMRVEMSVRLQNSEGATTRTFNNDACWTAS